MFKSTCLKTMRWIRGLIRLCLRLKVGSTLSRYQTRLWIIVGLCLATYTLNWYFCWLGCSAATKTRSRPCHFPGVGPVPVQQREVQEESPGIQCPTSKNEWLCISNSVVGVCDANATSNLVCTYSFYKSDLVTDQPSTVVVAQGSDKVPLMTDVFEVKCQDSSVDKEWNSLVAGIAKMTPSPSTESKRMQWLNVLNVSVLAWDLGPVSRFEFSRLLPLTSRYVEEDLRGFVFGKYNSLDLGDSNPLFPLVTGKTRLEWEQLRGKFLDGDTADELPFVWKDFADHGYVTAFADDSTLWDDTGSEGFHFRQKPTHHHLGKFYYSTVKRNLSKWPPFCLDDTPRHKALMTWVMQFFDSYQEQPKFAFVANRELAKAGSLSKMDKDLKDFLHAFKKKGYLQNTLVLLFGDRGSRSGMLGNSYQAKLEGHWPFLNLILPEWAEFQYLESADSLQTNTERMLTQLDIHATLLGVLDFDNFRMGHKHQKEISLFDEIPTHRACQNVGLDPSSCLCLSNERVNLQSHSVKQAAQSAVDVMNNKTEPYRYECRWLTVGVIEWAEIQVVNPELLHPNQQESVGFLGWISEFPTLPGEQQYFSVTLSTKPGYRQYLAYVVYHISENKFETNLQKIRRIDDPESDDCFFTDNVDLTDICYCADD